MRAGQYQTWLIENDTNAIDLYYKLSSMLDGNNIFRVEIDNGRRISKFYLACDSEDTVKYVLQSEDFVSMLLGNYASDSIVRVHVTYDLERVVVPSHADSSE